MNTQLYAQVTPEYLNDLPAKYAEISAVADMSKVQDPNAALYGHLKSMMGVSSMKRSKGFYHPSSIGSEYFCPFEAVQPRLLKPSVYNKKPEGTLTVNMGSQIHLMVQGYLKDLYGDKFTAEVPARYDPLHLAGTCDGVIQLDVPQIIEIKSIRSLPRSPKPAHILQAHIYEFMLGIGVGTIIYVERTNPSIVGFTHTFDIVKWATVADRIAGMEACLVENRVPPPKPHNFCGSCSYFDVCPNFNRGAR